MALKRSSEYYFGIPPQSCLWRIHGLPNKKISLSITTYADTNQIDGIWFFDGLHNIETEGGNFIRLPKNVTTQVETEYFIDSNTATIIIDFELAEMLNDGKIAQVSFLSGSTRYVTKNFLDAAYKISPS